ncbi:MAG: hypothetical protein AABY73_08980 [Pseudomonadota bacterium]
MAFLDELKKEAEAQKLQEQTQTQSKLAAVSQNFLLVQTKYKEIHHYLRELVNQLNVLNQDIKRAYMIEGFGLIDDFRPRDYALSVDSIRIGQKDFANTLVFRFKCGTEKEISVERNVPSQIDNLKEYLWQNNLKYQCTEFKNDRGMVARAVFNVTNEIPVTFRFSADFENAKIFLQVKNFNGLTVNEYVYEVNEMTAEFLEELAKYVLEKPSKFRELGRHQQSFLALTRQARQQKEATYSQAPAEPELDEAAKNGGFFNRLKSILS